MLHIKYISSVPHGFREEDFLIFPIISLWELMTPGEWPVWAPDWQDLCMGPLSIATYKICKLWASWFQRRRFFFIIFFIMGVNDPGAWLVWALLAGLAGFMKGTTNHCYI